MTKNPLINAVAALLYITLVVLGMNYASKDINHEQATVIMHIVFLSLFTLSAAVMGYIFMFQPLQLFLDGDKKTGVNLFLQTVGVFAVITLLAFFALLAGVFS